jgi:hypothetical protein
LHAQGNLKPKEVITLSEPRTFRDWWHDLPGSVQVFVLVALITGAIFLWAMLNRPKSPCPQGYVGTVPGPDGPVANCGVRQGDTLCFNDPQTGRYTCAPILNK